MKRLPILRISIAVAILVVIMAGVAVAAPLTGLFTGGGNWQWVSPALQGNTIYSLSFPVDTSTGWAAGIGGTVLKTVNGGDAWTVQTPSTQCGASPGAGCSLFGADFIDNSNGWVVGDYGTIWHTVNGGSSWAAQSLPVGHAPSPTVAGTALQGVDFFDAAHGVAVGSGYAFYTSNGGTTWTLAAGVVTSHYLSSVQMVSSTVAWAVGSEGKIYKSTDAGHTWVSQTSPTTDNLKGVFFTDATHGLAAGGDTNGRLLRYNGASWEANTGAAPIATPLWGVTNAAGTLVAVGQGGAILTYTGTNIWTDAIDTVASGLSAASSGTSSLLMDVVAAPGGIVVYASGEAGAITRSGNSGGAWVMKAGGDSKNFTASSFISATEGWVGGSNGEVTHTTDGGGSWTNDKTGLPADVDLRGIQFVDATHGFAVGCQGADCPTTGAAVAYKYVSGTWSAMTGVPGGIVTLASVHMTDATHGWAVGSGGTTLRTTDGSSWNAVSGVPANIELNGVDAVGSSAWAVGGVSGGTGVILKYNGSSWSAPISPPSAPSFMTSVDMIDANTGFAAGSAGKMYKTTAGGGSGTWALQTTTTGKLLGSVAFLDANLGYAAGEDGRVIKTTNGGATWTIESKVGTNIHMNTLSLARTSTDYVAYIAGSNAAVLKWARPAHQSDFWTWYDYQSAPAINAVMVANPAGAASNARVDLFIERSDQTLFDGGVIAPGTISAYAYPGLMGGPVDLGYQGSVKPVATQRSFWGQSLEEIEAVPESRLSDHYYWSWYDMQSGGFQNWVLVANSNDFAVDYEIRIAGEIKPGGSGTLQPGQRVVPTFDQARGGPVEVQAWQSGTGKSVAANVMASQRSLTNYGSALNEVPGIPASELSSDYAWTWYDSIGSGDQDWILVANPAGGESEIWYRVTIQGAVQDGSDFHNGETCKGPIPDNGSEVPKFPGLSTGPVRVETFSNSGCTTAANAIVSQRSLWGPSFEEVPGFPRANLTDTYNWPWYDQLSLNTISWVLIGNQNDFPVYYEITLGNGVLVDQGTIAANNKAIPTFGGQRTGPLKVRAWTGSDKNFVAPVMASQRVLSNGYFNELIGIVTN